MELRMKRYPVTAVAWGPATAYHQGRLTINREELLSHLSAVEGPAQVRVTTVELVQPGTSVRVVNIFDVIAPRARLDPAGGDWPGVLGPVRRAGHGTTAALDGMTVLLLTTLPDRFNKVLDMDGPGAEISPYATFCHLALQAEPVAANCDPDAYLLTLKRLGLAASVFLARAAATSAPPATEQVFTLDPRPSGLPRTAYLFMLASHQREVNGQPILYGHDTRGLLPVVLHPNEVLDGALVCPFFNLATDTYSYQNSAVVNALYARHGRELDFAGVVVYTAAAVRAERERQWLFAYNLVTDLLGCDAAVVTKVGGGAPETDLMMLIEGLEQRGVRMAAPVCTTVGTGDLGDGLSIYSPAADALISAGIHSAPFALPPLADAIGGPTAGPFTDSPDDGPRPAAGPLTPRIRDVAGAVDQLGGGRVKGWEY